MSRVALALLTGFVLSGCHGSERCRLRQENARLAQENAELRAATKKLIDENHQLQVEDQDDEDEMHLMAPSFDSTPRKRQARDLMDPFPVNGPTFVTAEQALEDAQEAYIHGQYSAAIMYAGKAKRTQPTKAYRLIGASHCFMKDKAEATRVLAKLDRQGQEFLRYVCARNGVKLGKGDDLGFMKPTF